MKAELQPVEIRWVDAANMHGWQRRDELEGDDGTAEVRTIGYLSRYSAKVVQVVQSRHVSDAKYVMRVSETITIPRGCVRKITPIRGLK